MQGDHIALCPSRQKSHGDKSRSREIDGKSASVDLIEQSGEQPRSWLRSPRHNRAKRLNATPRAFSLAERPAQSWKSPQSPGERSMQTQREGEMLLFTRTSSPKVEGPESALHSDSYALMRSYYETP